MFSNSPSDTLKKIFFSDLPWGEKEQAINIGDKFYRLDGSHQIWCVKEFCDPSSYAVPHVIIAREGVFADTKVIAAETLLDRENYRPDRRAAGFNVSGRYRRRGDVPSST